MINACKWMTMLVLAAGLTACPDDGDDDGAHAGEGGDHGDHDHSTCGLQANCSPDAPDLASGPSTGAGPVSFMVHSPSAYTTNEDTGWISASMMLHFMDDAGNALTNTAVKVYTFSEDCGHKGPTMDLEGTTNDMGMVMFDATFAHGGPWSIVAEVTTANSEDEIGLELCVPGEEHAGGVVDHSGHMADTATDHSGHME